MNVSESTLMRIKSILSALALLSLTSLMVIGCASDPAGSEAQPITIKLVSERSARAESMDLMRMRVLSETFTTSPKAGANDWL